jgi:hypothetical protein
MILSSYDRALLPKIWIERIPQYWERKVPNPSSYPKTTTSFDLKFEPEDKEAIKDMESKLNTEESIVTPDLIPEGNRLGGYLGAYEVNGVAGEETLIFPEKIPDNVVDVLAFHYTDPTNAVVKDPEEVVEESEPTEETTEEEVVKKEWVKIEDAHIVDGYVYGTLDSFSPIVVFTIKRTGYFKENVVVNGFGFGHAYICNGCPTTVKAVDGKVHIIDSQGIETEYDNITTVISGTIDGSEVDEIDLSIVDFLDYKKNFWVFHGSPVPTNESVVKIKESKLTMKNTPKNVIVATTRPGNRVENFNINFDNVTLDYVGCGESIVKGFDFNGPSDEALSLASPSWVNNCTWNIVNSKIGLFYPSGHCGRFYVNKTKTIAKDSEFYEYFITGGSNGRTDYCESELENCKIAIFQTVNRGIVRESRSKLTNCEVENCYVAGDASDKTVTGQIDKVYLSFVGGKINLHRGTNKGELLTKEDIANIVEKVKATVSTELTYATEEDKMIDVIISVRDAK